MNHLSKNRLSNVIADKEYDTLVGTHIFIVLLNRWNWVAQGKRKNERRTKWRKQRRGGRARRCKKKRNAWHKEPSTNDTIFSRIVRDSRLSQKSITFRLRFEKWFFIQRARNWWASEVIAFKWQGVARASGMEHQWMVNAQGNCPQHHLGNRCRRCRHHQHPPHTQLPSVIHPFSQPASHSHLSTTIPTKTVTFTEIK